jgi:hypothetical protein
MRSCHATHPNNPGLNNTTPQNTMQLQATSSGRCLVPCLYQGPGNRTWWHCLCSWWHCLCSWWHCLCSWWHCLCSWWHCLCSWWHCLRSWWHCLCSCKAAEHGVPASTTSSPLPLAAARICSASTKSGPALTTHAAAWPGVGAAANYLIASPKNVMCPATIAPRHECLLVGR